MKNCKPCMSIEVFFFLVKKHYKAFVSECKSYKRVRINACDIHGVSERPSQPNGSPYAYGVQQVRAKAQMFFNKKKSEQVQEETKE